jgi:hypothetical protein
MDTLPPEVCCMILDHLEPIWLVSASMASRGLYACSLTLCDGASLRMPSDAMEKAAAGGHWDFMVWLRARLYWPWTPLTVAVAALHNRRTIFERLLQSRTCGVDARAAAAALVGGGPPLLITAFQYGCPESLLLVTVAALLGHVGIATRPMYHGLPNLLMGMCAVATGNSAIIRLTAPTDRSLAWAWLRDPDTAPLDLRVAARQIDALRGDPRELAKRLAIGEIARRPPQPNPDPDGACFDSLDLFSYHCDLFFCRAFGTGQWHEETPPKKSPSFDRDCLPRDFVREQPKLDKRHLRRDGRQRPGRRSVPGRRRYSFR